MQTRNFIVTVPARTDIYDMRHGRNHLFSQTGRLQTLCKDDAMRIVPNCYATDTRETYLIFTGGLLGRRYRVVTRPDHDILATEQNTCVHICTNPSNTVLRASPGSHAPPLLRLIGKACEDIMNQPRRNYNCVPVGCSTSHPPIVTHFMKPDSVCSSSQPLRTFP